MIKFLLVPLNLIFLFGISSLLSGDLTIEQIAPDRIPVQGTCEVELTINKGQVSGFAKLQHTFPSGVKVEAIETQGATFTFAEQKMKWIWMALPQEETFNIKYKLTVEDAYLTEVELGGTFSYLAESERKSFFIPATLLAVGEETNPEDEVKDPVVATERKLTDNGDGTFNVDVHITRENVTGFAKVQEYIPSGMSATSISEQGSVFSVVNDKVKFVWMNLPEDDKYTVSYKLNTNGQTLDASTLTGEFAYIHDGQTLKSTILSDGQSAVLASETTEDNSNSESDSTDEETEEVAEVTTEESEIETEAETNPTETEVVTAIATGKENTTEALEAVAEESEAEEITETSTVSANSNQDLVETDVSKKNITTTPEPNTGINYRVQILAGHNNVKQAYFEKEYKFAGNFIVETHEGWMKYTTGDYPMYKGARDSREDIKSSYEFPGPFVVAYNNGERITVQEALMITNQKWVK